MSREHDVAGNVVVSTVRRKRRTTVLLVDDDPAGLAMLRLLFEEQDYHVIAATNGLEAIKAHSAHDRVDLIVSDIDMPEMDGMQLARWLDGNGKDAPVIIVSGLEVDPDEVCASAESVVGFFAKPVDIQALLETARAAVAS